MVTKGIKAGAQVANVTGGTGEKLLREHNNRNAANALRTSDSQGDKALGAQQLIRNDLGSADKVFEALTAKVDHQGRSANIHAHLASNDPAKRQQAMNLLKAQRSSNAPRFNLNDQIRSAHGLAGVAHQGKRSEDARQKLIRDHHEEIAMLHDQHKRARKYDSFDHNLGIDSKHKDDGDD